MLPGQRHDFQEGQSGKIPWRRWRPKQALTDIHNVLFPSCHSAVPYTPKHTHSSFHLSRGESRVDGGLNWMKGSSFQPWNLYDCRDLEPNHSSIHPPSTYSPTHPFIHLLIHETTQATIHLFIHLTIHSSYKHCAHGTCLAPYNENTGRPGLTPILKAKDITLGISGFVQLLYPSGINFCYQSY